MVNLIYFNYILLIILLQLSQFFPLCPPPPSPTPTLQAIPTPLSMSMHDAYIFFGYSMSYACTLHPPDYSVTTNLYFLIPFFAQPPILLPPGNHRNVPCIYDSISVLVVYFCFFRFNCFFKLSSRNILAKIVHFQEAPTVCPLTKENH